MPSYAKLAGNVRRFKTLLCLSTEKFDLLFARMEKAHPETERERLSKRPHGRAIESGRRFALSGAIKIRRFSSETYCKSDMEMTDHCGRH